MQHSPDYRVVVFVFLQVLKHSHANMAGFAQNTPQNSEPPPPPTLTAKGLLYPAKWSTATNITQDFIRSNCSSKCHTRPSYHQSFTHLGTVKSTSIFIVHTHRNINTHTHAHTRARSSTQQLCNICSEHQSEQRHTRKKKPTENCRKRTQKYIQVKKKRREEIGSILSHSRVWPVHFCPNHTHLRALKDIERRRSFPC